MNTTIDTAPRILVVDDNTAIHEDFRKTLLGVSSKASALADLEAELFSKPSAAKVGPFRVDFASQGQEALALVEAALKANDPYALAFVDIRMPPGWDGVETIERVWKLCPDLQAVMCTAYSDYSWHEIIGRFGHVDNLLILKKPFETVEVLQLAHALTRKWLLGRQAPNNCCTKRRNVPAHRAPCSFPRSGSPRHSSPAQCRWRFKAGPKAAFWLLTPASLSWRDILPTKFFNTRATS
jgi:CheY-like chemotaxis protein